VSLGNSLRVRVTATFVAIATVLVAGGYGGAIWLLHRTLWEPLDASLHEKARALELVSEDEDDDEPGQPNPGEDQAEDLVQAVHHLGGGPHAGEQFVAVTTFGGEPIASAGRRPAAIDTRDIATMGERILIVPDGQHVYRVITHQLGALGWAAIGVRVDRQMRALRWASIALGGGAVVMLGAIAFLAWSISSSATREMDELTAELEAIESASDARRVQPRRTSEVRRLADALNRLLVRLELADARLRRFTADAAHELRTPIAALRAHLDVALARPPSIDAYRDGLLDAVEQTERLTVLAEDLLTLSAVESGASTRQDRVDVGALAKEVAEFLESVAQEQGREFGVAVDPATYVRGDGALLKRLLLNLLGNAFRHTAAGVPVRLEVSHNGAQVGVRVSDFGCGISEAQQRVLFERLAGKRAAGPGSGLGLAICREIVAVHRGTIAVESAAGRGTTVVVDLPAFAAS